MSKQQELAQKYAEQQDFRDAPERDYFIDHFKCDVCSSPNLHFTQKQNGIIRKCKDCEKFMEENYSSKGEYIG
jgi:hypothetical protein